MTQPIGVDILLALVFIALGAGAMWLYSLAERATSREREGAASVEISRMLKWLREKDERLAKLGSEIESLRIANAEWQTAATVEKESRIREHSAFEEDRKRLEETFRSIGAQILDANTEKIMSMSQQVLEHQRLTATIELEHMLSPVGQTMLKLEEQIEAIESARAGDRETLKAGLELLGKLLSAWRAGAVETNGVAMSRPPSEVVYKRDVETAGLPQAHAPQKAFENPVVADIGAMLREYSSPSNRYAVRFRFPDANDRTVSEREVEPYGVFERGGAFSLIGYDRGRKAWRTFDINKFASKPVKAGKCEIVRTLPDHYRSEELIESANGRQPDVTLALTLKEKEAVLPRHADGGKSVNNVPTGVGRPDPLA